jgi:cytochrome b
MSSEKSPAFVRVWDLSVRMFHWSLVAAFFVAYLTDDDLMEVHEWAGYIVGGLIVYRVIWGFIGPEHARFRDFIFPPATVIADLRDLAARRSRRYLGHSPGGGVMVITLLALCAAIVVSGVILYAADQQAGPLAGLIAPSDQLEEAMEEVHEFLANFTVALVAIHVCAVLFASFVHRENLIKAMFTGHKRREP